MGLRCAALTLFTAFSLNASSIYAVTPVTVGNATALNNAGQLAGTLSSSPSLGFIGTPTTITSVISPAPGYTDVTVLAMNDSGQVTGILNDSTHTLPSTAFIGSASGSSVIPPLAALTGSQGVGINNSGQVAGYFPFAGGHPFIGNTAGSTEIPAPAGFTLIGVQRINGFGQAAVLGFYSDLSGFHEQALIGTTSGATPIPLPAGWTDATPFGINDAGQVAGYGGGNGSDAQAFVGTASSVTVIPYAPGSTRVSFATINNLGQVAGYYSLPTTTRAWIWDAVNGVQYLDDLLPAGWNMETVLDINDMGQILGYGNFGGGSNQELLLTPSVPEPSTWVLMVCGLFGLIIFRRRATSSPE